MFRGEILPEALRFVHVRFFVSIDFKVRLSHDYLMKSMDYGVIGHANDGDRIDTHIHSLTLGCTGIYRHFVLLILLSSFGLGWLSGGCMQPPLSHRGLTLEFLLISF